MGTMIISVLNNKSIYYSSVFFVSVSDGPGDAQSPSTEEPPTPTESPEVKEGSQVAESMPRPQRWGLDRPRLSPGAHPLPTVPGACQTALWEATEGC